MKNPRAIAAKVKKDHALNLSELAVATGYDRNQLGKMRLPLQAGKISLSDFRRVLRKRQDAHEFLLNSSTPQLLNVFTPLRGASPSGDAAPMRAIADKFYESSSKSAARSA